jgi:DNA-binding response OmpR family regulator
LTGALKKIGMNRILIVDDDQDILTLVKIALTMNNFMVEAIPRWEEIDNSILQFNPDLILLDVSLTGADGRDICKKIKEKEETKHIPVILFSANAKMEAYVQDCQATTFIAKPIELSYLLETIKTHAGAA